MGTQLLKKGLPSYYKKIKYPKDDVYKLCKQCVNYSFGNCKLFMKKINVARDYFCHGWYLQTKPAVEPLDAGN